MATAYTTRAARPGDAAAIADIHNQGIEAPGQGIVAFAASFPYSSRPCYAGIGEFSVYVARFSGPQRWPGGARRPNPRGGNGQSALAPAISSSRGGCAAMAPVTKAVAAKAFLALFLLKARAESAPAVA